MADLIEVTSAAVNSAGQTRFRCADGWIQLEKVEVDSDGEVGRVAAETDKAEVEAKSAASTALGNSSGRSCTRCTRADLRLRACSRCKAAWYCSRECQRADYASHKPQCIRSAVPPPTHRTTVPGTAPAQPGFVKARSGSASDSQMAGDRVVQQPCTPAMSSETALFPQQSSRRPAKARNHSTMAENDICGLNPRPGILEFFSDTAVPVELRWSSEKGRHLVAQRTCPAGSIVLAADAYAVVPAAPRRRPKPSTVPAPSTMRAPRQDLCVGGDDSSETVQDRLAQLHDFGREAADDGSHSQILHAHTAPMSHGDSSKRLCGADQLKTDTEMLRLAAAILTRTEADTVASDAKNEERGVHYAMSFSDVEDLVSHSQHMRKHAEELQILQQSAQMLRRALGPIPAAAAPDSVLGTLTTDTVVGVLLRIKYNAHPVLDVVDRNRKIGLGLFPAACYINHGCSANVAYSHTREGRTIVFRALRHINAGEEIVYSYVQEYQTVEERRKLLQDGFLIHPSTIGRGTDRLLTADKSGAVAAPEGAVIEAQQWFQRASSMLITNPQAGMGCLTQLSSSR
jgi:hypothetical protein